MKFHKDGRLFIADSGHHRIVVAKLTGAKGHPAVKASAEVLRSDKELLVFPVLSGLAAMAIGSAIRARVADTLSQIRFTNRPGRAMVGRRR